MTEKKCCWSGRSNGQSKQQIPQYEKKNILSFGKLIASKFLAYLCRRCLIYDSRLFQIFSNILLNQLSMRIVATYEKFIRWKLDGPNNQKVNQNRKQKQQNSNVLLNAYIYLIPLKFYIKLYYFYVFQNGDEYAHVYVRASNRASVCECERGRERQTIYFTKDSDENLSSCIRNWDHCYINLYKYNYISVNTCKWLRDLHVKISGAKQQSLELHQKAREMKKKNSFYYFNY